MSNQFSGEAAGFYSQQPSERVYAASQEESRYCFGQSVSSFDGAGEARVPADSKPPADPQCPVDPQPPAGVQDPVDPQGPAGPQAGSQPQDFDPDLCPEDREASSHNKELGKRGEEAATRYLERRGYNILARNWTCEHGEADIIAQDESALVFVEVKTRANCDYGMPEEAVTPEKRNRYERIACAFLREYPGSDIPIRFDVIGLLVVDQNRALIKHHINAFGIG